MRILVVEDNRRLRESIVQGLREEKYAVDATSDGEEAVQYARVRQYDLILLDLMLPGMNGLEILKLIRARKNPTAVMIMTARDGIDDRVRGLDSGADDYLVKPFALKELVARTRALIRRSHGASSSIVVVDDFELDMNSKKANRAGRAIELTAREYAILELLTLHAGRVVTRAEILDKIYDFDTEPGSNVIDAYIRRLRNKLESGGQPRLIQTRRGFGYMLRGRSE